MQDVKGSNPSRLSGADKIPLLRGDSSYRTQDAALQASPGGSWARLTPQLRRVANHLRERSIFIS